MNPFVRILVRNLILNVDGGDECYSFGVGEIQNEVCNFTTRTLLWRNIK